MKRLYFCYRMNVTFSEPVSDHSFTLKCVPKNTPYQEIEILHHEVMPHTWIAEGRDSFGNPYIYGKAAKLHTEFSVFVEGYANVHRLQEEGFGKEEQMESDLKKGIPFKVYHRDDSCSRLYYDFMAYPTKLTAASEEIQRVAEIYREKIENGKEHFPEHIYALMQDIYQWMTYAPGTTNLKTTAGEAYFGRQGVCQDYAHIMLAVCRCLHIPCLYIAGYMEGEGASHAWVRVYDREKEVFYEIDPTNARWAGEEYIEVLCGKDAQDCLMNKGIYRGCAMEEQNIHVIVEGKKNSE